MMIPPQNVIAQLHEFQMEINAALKRRLFTRSLWDDTFADRSLIKSEKTVLDLSNYF